MIRHASLSTRHSSLFDIKPTPLSIRSRDWRKPPAIERIRAEFAEMRGFSPTLAQAARLFNLPLDECRQLLAVLEQDGSVHRDEDGRYRLMRA